MRKSILLLSLLSGCVSYDYEAAQQQRMAEMQYACRSYGFEPQTDAFAGCMQQEAARRNQAALQARDKKDRELQCALFGNNCNR